MRKHEQRPFSFIHEGAFRRGSVDTVDIVVALFEWARDHSLILWVISVFSLVTFIGTLAALPFFIARIPEDYFLRSEARSQRRYANFPAHLLLYLIVKNLAGIVFIIAGVVMLFIPGQGILTILIGVMLMNFPGKRLLALRGISQPSVFRAVNWMRARSQKPPLMLPRTNPVKHD